MTNKNQKQSIWKAGGYLKSIYQLDKKIAK